MSTSKKLAAAALTGLFTMGVVGAAVVTATDAQAVEKSATASATAEKHACKGQNSCKGNGGCKTGDNGCAGKNSCKGKGGCATDGSKK